MDKIQKIHQEIERRLEKYDPDYTSAGSELKELLSFVTSLQQEQPDVDLEVNLESYISNKLRKLGADLINHKPYSFNRGVNVGETNAYQDILDKLNARKEE